MSCRARFDEQNNIDWSERLEEAGCRVIYGFEGYKVHSKICLITYRSKNEIQYITQVGTGNYNEKTAKHVHGPVPDDSESGDRRGRGRVLQKYVHRQPGREYYRHLIVSPTCSEAQGAAPDGRGDCKGSAGDVIIMKMNSLTDVDFIDKVAEASRAGVKIDLIVRGICCILPGVPGYTDNLTVSSIVGTISGASQDILLRHRGGPKDLHRICGYDDPQHGEAGGGGLPGTGRCGAGARSATTWT